MEHAVDIALIERQLDGRLDKDHLIVTTSHESESLDDALWFFLYGAFPGDAGAQERGSMLVIQIGANDKVASRVRFALTEPAKFNEQVCAEEP